MLGLARTGLIFTRRQEGTQPDWLIQTGQKKQGILYHLPSSWVLDEELAKGEVSLGSGACRASGSESCCVHWVVVLCILLLSIIVVALRFVCYSVKLPLSWPIFFCPHHPSGGRGNRATVWPFVAGHGQTATTVEHLERCMPRLHTFSM